MRKEREKKMEEGRCQLDLREGKMVVREEKMRRGKTGRKGNGKARETKSRFKV